MRHAGLALRGVWTDGDFEGDNPQIHVGSDHYSYEERSEEAYHNAQREGTDHCCGMTVGAYAQSANSSLQQNIHHYHYYQVGAHYLS